MHFNFPFSWQKIVQDELAKPYINQLIEFLEKEYEDYTCYPREEQLFSCFEYCSLDACKVVILGQDPYHGIGQANGLCFSVPNGIEFPPSLKNIFKELHEDLNVPIPKTGALEKWASQGVLLLNATLSVRENSAGSHQGKGWETFTDAVIKKLSEEKQNLVFLLWGNYAQKKRKLIDKEKHLILASGHPSPLSANRGFWFGNKHFSKTNDYLKKYGFKPIHWDLNHL